MTPSQNKTMLTCIAAATLLAPMMAFAAINNAVPEPGSWALVGIGLVAAVLATLRNRRK